MYVGLKLLAGGQAVLAGGLLADIRGLDACLRQLVSPIYYLDFESVSPLRYSGYLLYQYKSTNTDSESLLRQAGV